MCPSDPILFVAASNRPRPGRWRAFTLIEVAVATLIMAILAGTVLVILDRCIETTMDIELRTRAFVVARENMESLLGKSSVGEMTEVGEDVLNPAISWQTIVEPFYLRNWPIL